MNAQYDLGYNKTCSVCKTSKRVIKENFAICKRGIFGVSPYCKPCARNKQRDNRNRNRAREPKERNYVAIKRCSKCKEVFPTAGFSISRVENDGLCAYCKSCSSARSISDNVRIDKSNIDFIFNRIKRFDNRCAYCKINPYEHLDHFFPKHPAKGALRYDSVDNLYPSCSQCNQSKGNREPYGWLYGMDYEIDAA